MRSSGGSPQRGRRPPPPDEMPCAPKNHLWKEAAEIEPVKVSVKLDPVQITDVLHESEARELAEKGVLVFEDLPLFLGKGPARVWTRYDYPRATSTVRRWKRTCMACGFEQTTHECECKIVPVFDDPTPEENFVSKDGTVYA